MVKRSYRKGRERDEQFQAIIEKGREIFATNQSISLEKLAKSVGLSGASSLYRYVKNKRELWFAIVINDFDQFAQELGEIISDPQMVSYKQILLSMCHHFLKLSREDFPRFKIMLLTEPPGPVPQSEDEKGDFEKAHTPVGFDIYVQILSKALNAGEIKSDHNPFVLTGLVWSFLLGAATSTSPLYAYLGDDFLQSNAPPGVDVRLMLHNKAVETIEQLIDQ